MRRKQRSTTDERALEMLRGMKFYHLATTRPDGYPVLRALNGVVVDDWVLFHGAFAGEKSDCLDRPAVVSAYEAVADIPSYFVDPVKGCPATTYFQSVQAHGTLRDVSDHELKVRMLTALMEKYQPECGYAPFSDDMYSKDLRGVRVFGLAIDSVTGKQNVGKDRPTEFTQKIVEGLWKRGAPGDCQALETILLESPAARPAFLRFSDKEFEFDFRVSPTPEHVSEHAALLAGQYWRTKSTASEIEAAIVRSSAWIGAVDTQGALVAAARASTDGVWSASIADVVVAPSVRGRGLGTALMKTLLAHPEVRGCRHQRLGTMDGIEFYERLGFRRDETVVREFVSHAMLRVAV